MPSAFDSLLTNLNLACPNLLKSREDARKKVHELRSALSEVLDEPDPDLGLVVSGSLARLEWTSNSDIDWLLLVDGAVQTGHLDTAKRIEVVLDEKLHKKPNPNGAFGNLVFSHNLVHLIGGNTDTNANTTQRILLLLESTSIGDDQVRSRVTRAILGRYLEHDTHFNPKKTPRIPRFLLNDIIRYWRTMAVDYASKHRAEAGRKFAIRNIKLRMSRKLIFASGLLMVFACHADPPPPLASELTLFGSDDEETSNIRYIGHLEGYVNQTPLDILADACMRYGADREVASDLFEAYDVFLGRLDDAEVRKELEAIDYQQSKTNKSFIELREISHRFQQALTKLFFDKNVGLSQLVRDYAVF